jgi:cytoskeletal protein CcmA (bactofilin family)
MTLPLISLVLALLLAVYPVSAADFRSGDTIEVASGETVNDDLYIGAGTATINGTVNGDLIVAGGAVNVNGRVAGSVLAAGGNLNLNGQVDGSVRVAGGQAQISGRIGRDLVWTGGMLSVGQEATIAGEMVGGGGSASMAGTITKGIRGGFANLAISGRVGGDVDIEVDQLTITSTATIAGQVIYRSDTPARIDPGAKVTGPVTQRPATQHQERERPGFNFGFWLLGLLMALLAGALFILAFPVLAVALAATNRRWPLPTLGWGAVILFGAPIVAVLLLITVIGIPLSLALVALYIAALWFAQIPVALFIGTWIITRFRPVVGRGALILALLLGLVILSILTAIPFLGTIVGFFIIVFGIGALWLGLWHWLRGERPNAI